MRAGMRLGVALAALPVAAVAVLYVYVDAIAGRAIERGATSALGVETKVGLVRLSLLRGSLNVGSLKVRNPPGAFDEEYLLEFDDARIQVDLGTLREDVVVASRLTIDGVLVDLEKDAGQTNFGKVLDNLGRSEDAGGADPAPSDKRIVVKELVIRDLVAHYEHTDRIGKLGKIDVVVDEVRLQDIGTDHARGVSLDELSGIIVRSVFLAIARNGAALPNWLVGDLLGGLRDLGSIPIEVVGTGAGALVDVLPEPAGDAARELGARAGQALEDLGGLFRRGGKRD